VDLPLNAAALPPKMVWSDVFTTPTLPAEFQWLRTPHPDRIFSMTGTALRMTGRESIGSWFEQSLVARRQQEASYQAQTCVVAAPVNWQTAAGLVTYYNRHKFHAALITHQAGVGRVLTVVSCLGDWPGEALTISVQAQPVPQGALRLKVVVDGISQQFLWASEGADFIPLGPILDASLISDEGGRGEHASFTGAFVGMFAMDLTGQGWSADFFTFEYQNMV
jgi:xylan 1,4-beta-xylosidase